MTRTIRDVLGDPESWPNFRDGGWGIPDVSGATVVGAREAEPDELRIAIEVRGQILHSTFAISDANERQRILRVLQPGTTLENCLNHLL